MADQVAKDAIYMDMPNIKFPHTDKKQQMNLSSLIRLPN